MCGSPGVAIGLTNSVSRHRHEGGVSSRKEGLGFVDGSKVLAVRVLLLARLCLKFIYQRLLSVKNIVGDNTFSACTCSFIYAHVVEAFV